MKIPGVLIVFSLISMMAFGQQNLADSLVRLAGQTAGIEKAELLNAAAECLLEYSPQQSLTYAREALEISRKENNAREAYYSMLFMSNAFSKTDNHLQALQTLQTAGENYGRSISPLLLAQLNNQIGFVWEKIYAYEKAIDHQLKSLDILATIDEENLTTGARKLIISSNQGIGDIFNKLENYPEALDHYNLALEMSRTIGDSLNMAFLFNSMGIAYEKQGEFQSALDKYSGASGILGSRGFTHAVGKIGVNISLCYYFMGNYDEALNCALRALEINRKFEDQFTHATNLVTIGRIYLKMSKPDLASDYIMQGLEIAKEAGYTDLIAYSYELLSQFYALKNSYKNAYESQLKQIAYKDSLYDAELASKITDIQTRYETEKKEQEIDLLTKDAEIKDLRNKRQKAYLFALGGAVVLILIAGILWLSRTTEKQKRMKSELEKKNLETEQKLLRAQINPHFMFNALNSVQSYISANDNLKAMSYLAKFSQLMRNILENSRKSMISLEEETGTLKLYLELESMRFKNAFDYKVVIREGIIPSKTFIPPMLIQPFVENSVKHAFRNLNKKGKILVDFQRINGMISCVIQDNGIGRSKAMEMNKDKEVKHHSLGMQVTQERLISMRKDRKINVNYKIEDLTSPDGNVSGTRVLIEMPYELE